MKLDIYNRIALIFFSLWISFTVTAAYAGQWNDKPVMCEQKEEFESNEKKNRLRLNLAFLPVSLMFQ